MVTLRALLLLAATAALVGCSTPAVITAAPPMPLAVAPAGLTASASLGADQGSLRRGSASVVVRPAENVGLFASGLWAGRDSSDTAAGWIRHTYREAGVVGAWPLAPEAFWLTGAVAVGAGRAESGAVALTSCGSFGCSTSPYVVAADAERISGTLGLHGATGDGLAFGVGLRLVRARYHDVRLDREVDVPSDDFALWIGEPVAEVRYALGLATLDLQVMSPRILGHAPEAPDLGASRSRALYAAEPLTINVGATLDLWRLARGN